jgi:hypothetical protein
VLYLAAQGLNPGLRLRGLVSSSPSLLDLVPGVCGAAVMYGGKVSTIGKVLTYADVCRRMPTYADVCRRMLTYAADVSTVGKVPGIEVLTKLAQGIDKHWLECATGREAKAWDR